LNLWETLDPPWQAALEMAWEAYCAGTIPIGAVITDCDGEIVARGRNRIFDHPAQDGMVSGDVLAHAEINALLDLKLDQQGRHSAVLYTTMEPCPLCMGAFYMSSVRTLHYAARDPYAGSTNLLGTTPYLSRKSIRVIPPFNAALEAALIAMLLEVDIALQGKRIITSRYFQEWRNMSPEAVELGIRFFNSGELRARRALSADKVFNWVINQVQ
jgi:tRNA(adenine34) deaminase